MSTFTTSATDDLAQSAIDVDPTGRVSLSTFGSEAAFVSNEPRVGLANQLIIEH
jgi:hypothetical protein